MAGRTYHQYSRLHAETLEIVNLFTSNTNEDNSPNISSILRKREDNKFWDNVSLTKIFESYLGVYNKVHILKQFFSILMYDWHEYDKKTKTKYFLVRKFQAFEDVVPIYSERPYKTVLEKLFAVLNCKDVERYHNTCIKIIYHYVDELLSENLDGSALKISEALPYIMEIQNVEYKMKIIKVFSIFLSSHDIKQLLSNIEIFTPQNNYDYMINHCDKLLLELMIYIKDGLLQNFNETYKKYIETLKSYFGDYWSFAIKENDSILSQVHSDITPTSVTSAFRNVGEFQAVFNEPLNEADKIKHVSCRLHTHCILIIFYFFRTS